MMRNQTKYKMLSRAQVKVLLQVVMIRVSPID